MTEPKTHRDAGEQVPEEDVEPRLEKERLMDLEARDAESVKGGQTTPGEVCECGTM